MALQQLDLFETTLSAGYTAGGTSLALTSVAGLPASGDFFLAVYDPANSASTYEVFRATSGASGSVVTVVGGQANSTNKSHASGQSVYGGVLCGPAFTQLKTDAQSPWTQDVAGGGHSLSGLSGINATLPTYASDAAAGSGGLAVGSFYQFADGSVHIKLYVASTSYSEPESSGDRSGFILVTSNVTGGGYPQQIVDGTSGNGWYNAAVNLASGGPYYVQFDFCGSFVLQEVTSTYNNTNAQGTWQWKGSNNGSTWSNVGSTVSIGGATPLVWDLSTNNTSYRYYRLEGVSGTIASSTYWQEFTFKLTTRSNPNNTLYTHTLSTGNRSGSITVSATLTPYAGSFATLVNGNLADNNLQMGNETVSGKYLEFDFGTAKILDQARVILGADYSGNFGNYQWQGSNDNSTWTNIGAVFNCAGASNGPYMILVELTGNSVAYRYYRMLGSSGSSVFNGYWQEMEFRIN